MPLDLTSVPMGYDEYINRGELKQWFLPLSNHKSSMTPFNESLYWSLVGNGLQDVNITLTDPGAEKNALVKPFAGSAPLMYGGAVGMMLGMRSLIDNQKTQQQRNSLGTILPLVSNLIEMGALGSWIKDGASGVESRFNIGIPF